MQRASGRSLIFLKEDVGSDNDILPARCIGRNSRVYAGSVERPARNRTVRDRIVTFQHRHFGWCLPRDPVPFMVLPIGKTRGLANAVVIDTIVVDIRLVRERRPSAEYEGKLLYSFHGLGKVD